jgi:hypothetical protein
MKALGLLFTVISVGVAIGVGCGGTTADTTGGPNDGGGTPPDGAPTTTTTGTNPPPPGGPDSGLVPIPDSGVPTSDGGMVVQGNPFPCGQSVCNPPNVCCDSRSGTGGITQTCEAKGACMGVAVGCTADTCPSGSVCCGTLMAGPGGGTGYTACETGGCPSGTVQLCDPNGMGPMCPPGDMCSMVIGGGFDICRPPRMFDAGFPPPFDAATGG